MTIQEKAIQIIDKFRLLVDISGYPLPCKEEDEEETEKSKQCALICIEEILNLPVIWIDEKLQKEQPENYEPESTIEFWEQVKVEIEKQ